MDVLGRSLSKSHEDESMELRFAPNTSIGSLGQPVLRGDSEQSVPTRKTLTLVKLVCYANVPQLQLCFKSRCTSILPRIRLFYASVNSARDRGMAKEYQRKGNMKKPGLEVE